MSRFLKTAYRVFLTMTLMPLLILAGCGSTAPAVSGGGGGGGGTGGTGLTSGGATVLYAIQSPVTGSTSVLQFSLAASSTNLTPAATITAPTGVKFDSITTDSAGSIYVGAVNQATGQGEVLVYAAGSSGAATPIRTILGGTQTTTTTFAVPSSMHISLAGTLAILSYNNVTGYTVATMPATASGAVTPTTMLQGTATLLTGPLSVTIDQNGLVYVSNYYANGSAGSLLTFAAGATGNTAPTTVITTGNTAPYGIAVGSSGNIVTVVDAPFATYAGTLEVFAAGASGAATPTRTIYGSSTGIFYGGGVRMDTVGNIYTINLDSTGSVYSVVAFSSTATGNVAPGLTFQSSVMTLPDAQIAVR